MSDDSNEMQTANKWIDWIDDAISKKHIKYFEYEHFYNIQKISQGAFGKVYRANWRNWDQYLVLKSLFGLDNNVVKEIVHEVIMRSILFIHNVFLFMIFII